jgi:hypothetical protein
LEAIVLIAVIDAQGAGIGKAVIKELRKSLKSNMTIYALGTNEDACQAMKSAGADGAVSGDEKIIRYLESRKPDCIIGPMGILSSGGIKGEITSDISRAVFEADCRKYIIPLDMHGVFIPGTRSMKIKDSIRDIIADINQTF